MDKGGRDSGVLSSTTQVPFNLSRYIACAGLTLIVFTLAKLKVICIFLLFFTGKVLLNAKERV